MKYSFTIQNCLWDFDTLDRGSVIIAKSQSSPDVVVIYNRTSSNFSLSSTNEEVKKDFVVPVGVLLKLLSLSSKEMGCSI